MTTFSYEMLQFLIDCLVYIIAVVHQLNSWMVAIVSVEWLAILLYVIM